MSIPIIQPRQLASGTWILSSDINIAGGSEVFPLNINVVTGNPEIYSDYFVATNGSVTTTATFTTGLTSITVGSATGIDPGDIITGANIPAKTSVVSVTGTTVVISAATTGNSSGNYTFTGLFRVAKNTKLRCTIGSEAIDTVTWTYTYGGSSPYTFVTRKATNPGPTITEYQVICPRYLGGDAVWVIDVANSDISNMVSVSDSIASTPGAAIILLDINIDGRTWCARASQSGYENT